MPRRFALDQNFPEPIVDGLVDWLASDAELMPIRRIDQRMATGLVLAHITRICEQTRADTAQVWRLRTSTRPAEKPWDFLTRVAERRGSTARKLDASERLTDDQLARSRLD